MLTTTNDTHQHARSPERTCVGCRAQAAQAGLVRFAFDGRQLTPDSRRRLGGRGVWVHPRSSCIRSAVRGGGFARVLRAPVPFEAGNVIAVLREEQSRRVESLLGGARRARLAVHGSDESLATIARGTARLALVASDARAACEAVVEAASRSGVPVVEIEDKERLGRWFGKDAAGAVVVIDAALAREISQVATHVASLSEGE